MNKIVIILYITLCYFKSIAQVIDGIGLITPLSNEISTPKLLVTDLMYGDFDLENLKRLNIDLYSENKFLDTHCITAKEIKDSSGNTLGINYYIINSLNETEEVLNINSSSFFYHDLKQYSLQFYEIRGSFFKVKLNNKYYWVNQNNLNDNGYKGVKWNAYFKNQSSPLRVLYNLNLRKLPKVEALKIALIKQDFYHNITIKKNFKGNWVNVKVEIWQDEKEYCEGQKSIKELNGWIKYLDDKGYPNILDINYCPPL